MVAHTLPCAEKNCNSQMTLIENKEKTEELEKLQKLLHDNQQYIIEIGSHTDARGTTNRPSPSRQRR